MKKHLFACTLICLSLSTFAVAQTRDPNGALTGVPMGSTPSSQPSSPSILLSGKVVADDGSQLPRAAAIQTICKGQKRTVAHTDSRGRFSFTLGDNEGGMGAGFSDASMSANGGLPYGDTPNVEHNRREWRACGLQAELPGYTSEIVELIARTDNRGGNIGSIALHRIGPVEGNSISATSAAAPAEAREALEKGYEQVGKKKWDAARESFERAVQIYPQYAVAWFELGRVQMQKKDVAAAKHSFQQSLASDSHFASPYLGLTQIAVQEQRWQDIADLTSKLIALGSVNFPDVWYFSGVANYNLMKFSAAEKSVREGLRVDPDHHVPKLEYLLSVVLMEQHDYAGAREHMQNYLHLAINPRDVEGAQATLAEINRLSASATASAGNGKN